MIVGLDVDNVLYPFTEQYTRYAERIHDLEPGTLDDVAYSWAWYKDQWGWTTEKFMDTYVEAVKRGIWLDGDPRPGALPMARTLVNDGHRIVYVTARHVSGTKESILPSVAQVQTVEWLGRHGFPFPENVVVIEDKHEILTHVFLDDGPHIVESLDEHGHRHPVLLNREHNRGADYWNRVEDFPSFVDYVRRVQSRAWDVVA